MASRARLAGWFSSAAKPAPSTAPGVFNVPATVLTMQPNTVVMEGVCVGVPVGVPVGDAPGEGEGEGVGVRMW